MAEGSVQILSRLQHFRRVYATDVTPTSAKSTPLRSLNIPAHMQLARRYVTAEFAFFGTGASDANFAFDLYLIRFIGNTPIRRGGDQVGDAAGIFEPFLLVTGHATLAAASNGVPNGVVAPPDRFCDTLTIIKTSFASYLENLTGQQIQIYSPEDGGHLCLLGIPDMGGNAHGFVLDINELSSGLQTANALVSLWT